GFQHTEEVLARDPLLAGGLLVEAAELLLEHPVDPAGLLLLPQLDHVLALPDPAPTGLAGRVGPALDRALHRVALGALEEQLHLLPAAEPADGSGVSRHQTRLLFFGRQPLWGMGVTSLMPATSMPVFMRERMAVSRPEPG